MKIPSINYNTPVAPLPKQDLGPIVAQANAKQRLIGQVAAMGAEIYSRVQVQKGLDAFARSTEDLNTLEVEMRNRPASDPTDLKTEYDKRTGTISREAEKNLSGQSLKVWREKFGPKRQALWFGLSNTNASAVLQDQRKATMTSVNQLAEVDLPAALEQIDASPVFTDQEKSVGRDEIRTSAARAAVQTAEQSGNPDAMEAQLEILQTQDVALSETERHRSITYLKSARKEAIAKDVADLEQARAILLGDLEVGIDNGSVGQTELRKALANGTIQKTQKYVTLLRRIEKRREDSIEDSRLSATLSQALLSGEPMDPRDKDNIKAVNNRYAVAAKKLAETPLSAQQQAQGKEELTRRGMALAKATNILPEQMLGDLRRFAFAGSPASAAKQAIIYEKLQSIAPQALDKLSVDEESVYVGAAAMMRGGMSPEEAVVQARENVKLPPEVKAGFAKAYRAEDYGGDRLAEAFASKDVFDIEFAGEADPTPAQMGLYTEMERQFYLNNGGDIDLAAKAAINKFKRIFSGSTAGTPDHSQRVMPYAPERYYGMTTEAVQQDIQIFAKKNGLKNPKKAFISADNQTMRETDKTYPLWELNEFGLPQRPLDSNGITIRWRKGSLREQTLDVLREAENLRIRAAPAKKRAAQARKRITDKIVPDYSKNATQAQVKTQAQARVAERKRAVEQGRQQSKARSEKFTPVF